MIPFLHITTRIEGRKGDDLLSDKADRVSFPTLMIMDKDGTVVARHTQDFSVPEFERMARNAQAVVDLRKKAAGGDSAAKADLALMEVRSGVLDFYDLEDRLEGLKLTDAQKHMSLRLELEASVDETAMVLRKTPRAERAEARAEAGSEFLESFQAGVYSVGTRAQRLFWGALAAYAVKGGNGVLLGLVLAPAKEQLEDDVPSKPLLDRYQSKFVELTK